MKLPAVLCAILLLCGVAGARADEFAFQYNRFGGMTLKTTGGKEHIRAFQGDKEGHETTVFSFSLKAAGEGIYKTTKGTFFALQHLPQMYDSHNGHGSNMGDWAMTISGRGAEFEGIKKKLEFTVTAEGFPPMTYVGSKTK